MEFRERVVVDVTNNVNNVERTKVEWADGGRSTLGISCRGAQREARGRISPRIPLDSLLEPISSTFQFPFFPSNRSANLNARTVLALGGSTCALIRVIDHFTGAVELGSLLKFQ